jgi:DinB superfamily
VNFDQIIQELEDGGSIIQQMVCRATLTEARFKPTPDSWSILEVVCHLHDVEREDFRQRLDITLHQPGEIWPVIDPDTWVTQRNYNDLDLLEMLSRFTSERQGSVSWLRTLSGANLETEYTDPYGSMKAGDILASWIAHDNLHMRQLVELRRARLLTLTQPYNVEYAGEW